MKKFFKIILTTLTAIVCALSVTACDLAYPDYNDPAGTTHTCESVCPTCGKCTDSACQESACADKCKGHEPAPHVCESVCPTCNKCTDSSCQESACAEKCQGHEPATHVCESECPTCHKCKDKDCQDSACAEKCPGHSGGLVLGGIEGSFVAGGTFITK